MNDREAPNMHMVHGASSGSVVIELRIEKQTNYQIGYTHTFFYLFNFSILM